MLVGHIVSATYFDCGPTMFIDLLNSFVTHLSKFANKYLYLFFCWFKIVSRCNKRSNKNILKRKEEKKKAISIVLSACLEQGEKAKLTKSHMRAQVTSKAAALIAHIVVAV